MLSLEGVTHAPIDIGLQVGVELPIGLHVLGGYGWVPGAYRGLMSGVAGAATGDSLAGKLLSSVVKRGQTWRVQAGIRPFRSLGFYLDGGYTEIRFDGSMDAASLTGVSGLGPYSGSLTVRMWLAELGYVAWIARHVVVGVGLGVMRTSDAQTALAGPGLDSAAVSQAVQEVDGLVERYGTVPTLTGRVGFDFI